MPMMVALRTHGSRDRMPGAFLSTPSVAGVGGWRAAAFLTQQCVIAACRP